MNGEWVENSALTWLKYLDTEDYGQSWEQASSYFKNSLKKQFWMHRIDEFRKKIGPIDYRSVSLIEYDQRESSKLNCTVYFYSKYKNRIIPREALLMVFEDEDWKVAGYYAK